MNRGGFAVDFVQRSSYFGAIDIKDDIKGPVLFWLEFLDLFIVIDNHPESDRLDTSG